MKDTVTSAYLHIDFGSSVPIVSQIIDHIRVLLVEKKLRPGGRLPSVRRLANDLGVHFTTVASAYRRLAEEGWVEMRHGDGVIIIDRPIPEASTSTRVALVEELRRVVATHSAKGMDSESILQALKDVARWWSMNPIQDTKEE